MIRLSVKTGLVLLDNHGNMLGNIAKDLPSIGEYSWNGGDYFPNKKTPAGKYGIRVFTMYIAGFYDARDHLFILNRGDLDYHVIIQKKKAMPDR